MINKTLIKSFLPMAKQHMTQIDNVLAGVLQKVELSEGEDRALFVLFADTDDTIRVMTCGINKDDTITSVKNSMPLQELLNSLIEKI